MAYNVYLTIYRNYNAQQLKSLEWRYHLLCYGIPFVVAFVLLFAETKGKGKIYGDAVVCNLAPAQWLAEAKYRQLWCWVAKPYSVLRVALCYGPAWYVHGMHCLALTNQFFRFCIVTAFSIYLLAGFKIFSKRRELRAFHDQHTIESVSTGTCNHLSIVGAMLTRSTVGKLQDYPDCCDQRAYGPTSNHTDRRQLHWDAHAP